LLDVMHAERRTLTAGVTSEVLTPSHDGRPRSFAGVRPSPVQDP